MGFSPAPIIAQRTSNILVNMTKEMMTEQNIPGEVAAWVDNFMMFSDSDSCAERAMSILMKNLNAVQIACKEVDKTGEFVGLQRIRKSYLVKRHSSSEPTNAAKARHSAFV